MFNLIRKYQMNIMLCLCAVCTITILMLIITKFLSKKRKRILLCQETIALLLLFFDRMAYSYAGNTSPAGYVMVRLSNFFVFFLTSAIVFTFNYYIIDLMTNEGKLKTVPRRLIIVGFASGISMLLVIISAFTGFYYYFDSLNQYHRGPGFLFNYVIPILGPLLQFTVIFNNRKQISKIIYAAITLYIFLPIIMGVIQIFAYGISIVNMMMVIVSISLYVFSYLDINEAAEKAHKTEIAFFKEQQNQTKNIFLQASQAFASVIEKKNKSEKGQSERAAHIARLMAHKAGKSEEDCEKIFFAALLCDLGPDALAYIKDFPFLSETALYVGKGYNETIPEYARIITVAKDYDRMCNDSSIPAFFVRDTFLREAGYKYDPVYAKIAVRMLDQTANNAKNSDVETKLEKELISSAYREKITGGIDIKQNYSEITFTCKKLSSNENKSAFSIPALVVFDSSDERVQNTADSIESHKYLEYGEIWFDGHIISTGARNMQLQNVLEEGEDQSPAEGKDEENYEIVCGRFADHLLIKCRSSKLSFEVIIALPSASRAAYIGLTGENIQISDINIVETDHMVLENDIPRIADKLNFIDRISSDIPNVQIVSPLIDFTRGVKIQDKMNIFCHIQSLPDANLIWHCPYIILYNSDDKKPFGKNYREYAMIKIDGEDNGSNEYAENDFQMRKTEDFISWEEWENQNKAGYECQIEFFKKGSVVTIKTQNKGVAIQNVCSIRDGSKDLFVALSGDQVAITDIRIR